LNSILLGIWLLAWFGLIEAVSYAAAESLAPRVCESARLGVACSAPKVNGTATASTPAALSNGFFAEIKLARNAFAHDSHHPFLEIRASNSGNARQRRSHFR
jgi:hypothetical protein